MIQANELRIGNWIEFNGVECRVKGTHGTMVLLDGGAVHVKQDFINRIPISEEWLIKLGFTKNAESHVDVFIRHKTGEPCIKVTDPNWEGLTEVDNLCLYHIDHVHQLQNLYYSITEKELTIKP